MSIETEQYLRLKNKIYSDLNTKTFSINSWDKLVEIPHEICLLQQLEHLSVYKNRSIKHYPKELADLPKLRHISLRFNNLKQLPPVLGQLQQLETLNLSNNRFLASIQWTLLAQMTALKTLDLSYSLQNLSILPKAISTITSLRELNISGNKLKQLPNEFHQLQSLEILHCEMNDFSSFPTVITQLSNLKELRISAKSLEGLPDTVLELQRIPNLTFTGKSNQKTPYIYRFERLLKNIKSHNFSLDYQRFLLHIIRGSIHIQNLNNQELLSLLNCGISEYMHQALTELDQRILNQQFGSLSYPRQGDRIVIKGKIKGKVSDLKNRLQQNGVQTGSKINGQTTHILIGSQPGAVIHNLPPEYIVITEQLLVAHLNQVNQPYLLASPDEDNLEHIRQLLHSDQTENILLGLEILKGGGFPLELLTELFLVYKFSRAQKIKRTIHQIVGQYAPLNFVSALKSRKSISQLLSEMTRRQNLEYYCELGNLDKKYIAFYLLNKGNFGHLFALFNLSTEDKKEYFARALQNGHLSLSGLKLTELPDDLGVIPGLTHLDISYNKFTRVPPQLFACKELQFLYIRGLYEIHARPHDLWNIPALHKVYIGYNNKWELPTPAKNEFLIKGKTIICR